MDHVGDYIEMTGKSLGRVQVDHCNLPRFKFSRTQLTIGRVSDQIVECAHSALHRRLAISNYWVKNKEMDIYCIKLFRCIVHFNSYNI